MNIFEFFDLREGVSDKKFRDASLVAFQACVEGLKDPSWTSRAKLKVEAKGPVVLVNMGDLAGKEEYDHISLLFKLLQVGEDAAGAMARFHPGQRTPDGNSYIEILYKVFDPREHPPRIPGKKWLDKLEKNGVELLRDMKSMFVHEFIHLLDYERVKDPDAVDHVFRGVDDDDRTYYNLPIETNAYTPLEPLPQHAQLARSLRR